MNTEDFIKKARKVHGSKYDYSRSNFVASRFKVEIICPIHGSFWQTPNGHLSGKGCPECGGSVKSNTEDFIKKAKAIHGDNKYDYSRVNYINGKTKVEIICPEHGSFWQVPTSHLSGCGCPRCCHNFKSNTEDFIAKARKIHKDKYDYSQVKYINRKTKVDIICPVHGIFSQTPSDHLRGRGCRKCGRLNASDLSRLTTEEFIEKARKVHGDRYDYTKANYIDCKTKIEIVCPIHGSFWQTTTNHIGGRCGCPSCVNSKLETDIELYLKQNNILYISQKTWDWLVYDDNQKVDFYLPRYKSIIECQGKQHFEDIEFFGRGGYSFEKRVDMDENKRKLCEEHGLKVYYYSNLSKENDPYPYPYKVYEDITELFKIIQDDNPD